MAPLRAAAVKADNASEYMTLTRARDRHVRWRSLVAAVASVFGLGLALSMYVLAPGYLFAMAGAAVLALGYAGQRPDKPIIGPAVVKTELEKLTTSIVLRALGSIGNASINKALGRGGEGIRFTSEITRDGPGYRADVGRPFASPRRTSWNRAWPWRPGYGATRVRVAGAWHGRARRGGWSCGWATSP